MKQTLWIVICLLLCLPRIAAAQEYQLILETKGEYNALDKHSAINPGNGMGIGEVSSLTQLYPIVKFGYTQNNLATVLQVEGNVTNYDLSTDSMRFAFQELYAQFSVRDKHHVTVGKRRLNWGSGVLWNPTNFYVQKDPFRTQNRLEGIFQASYSLLFAGGSLQVYLFPEKRLGDFSYVVKYDYYGTRVDASLSFLQYRRYQQFGYSLAYGGNRSTLYAEGVFRNYSKSYRVGKDGRLVVPATGRKKFHTEAVVGFSMNFNAHLSLRGEYRFREDYLDKEEVALFEKYLPAHTMIYDPVSVGQHSLYGSAEWKDLYDQYLLQLRSFYDPVSRQLILSPLFVWKINNFQVEVSAMIYNNALAVFNYQGSVLLSCHF